MFIVSILELAILIMLTVICSQYAYNLLYVRGVFKPAVTDILRVPKIFTGIAVPLCPTIYSIYFFLTDRLHIIKKKKTTTPTNIQVEGELLMTLTFTQLIPVFLVFILYFAGLPIVYALFGSTFFTSSFLTPAPVLAAAAEGHELYTVFLHAGYPFFIMSGSVMNFGGISDKMMDFCECVTGHMRGGLAQVNVLLSMLMGGCSGSANADCAMQSRCWFPRWKSAATQRPSPQLSPRPHQLPRPLFLPELTSSSTASSRRHPSAAPSQPVMSPGILMSLSMMITVAIIAKAITPTTREVPPCKGRCQAGARLLLGVSSPSASSWVCVSACSPRLRAALSQFCTASL